MPLDDNEIQQRLGRVDGWQRAGDEITKEFAFPGFAEAMRFVNRVADAAQVADHHPDIDIRYNKVTLTLSTHSDGGLTAKDFDLAARADAAARERT